MYKLFLMSDVTSGPWQEWGKSERFMECVDCARAVHKDRPVLITGPEGTYERKAGQTTFEFTPVVDPIKPSRNPLRRKIESVTVEYYDDAAGRRVRKTFKSNKAAKRFYAAQMEAYAEPKIVAAEAN
jgi:hypothetical protein